MDTQTTTNMESSNESSEGNGAYYFQQFNQVLRAKPHVEEFDVIPCVRPEDRSCPVVIDGNNIAILSWCLKELFCFVYHELMKLKTNERDLEKEGNYMVELSRVALLLYAEDYSIWNLRKQRVIATENCRRVELEFCALVLKKHPRSSEAFAHRRWLIKQLLAENDEFVKTSKFLEEELRICLQCGEKHKDNYTAWSQRCWLVNEFMCNNKEQLLKELQNMESWIWTHLSDYCGFHFRQRLLENLKNSCSQTKMEELICKEFSMTEQILRRYPGHETVWYHRRFILSYWFTMAPPCRDCLSLWQQSKAADSLDELKRKSGRFATDTYLGYSEEHKCSYCNSFQKQFDGALSLKSEVCFCEKMMVISNENSHELKRQSHLAASQLQWLDHFLRNRHTGTVK